MRTYVLILFSFIARGLDVNQNCRWLWHCARHSHTHGQDWSNWKSRYVFIAVDFVHYYWFLRPFKIASITFQQIGYTLTWFFSLRNHKWRQNVIRTKPAVRCRWSSYRFFTSLWSIYYWTYARQHRMYLFYVLNRRKLSSNKLFDLLHNTEE